MTPVASLWIGGSLSFLDRLCLTSFAAQGHEVTLFHYEPIEGAPDGIKVVDAREIYPNDKILIHKNGSPAMHADIFRLHLMRQTPMIWVDTDMFCLAPFEAEAGYICPMETEKAVTNCVLRLPQKSAALAFMLEFVKDEYPVPPWVLAKVKAELEAAHAAGTPRHVTQQLFTTLGPRLLKYALRQSGEDRHLSPVGAYLPLPSTQHRYAAKARFFDQLTQTLFTPATKGVHLWGTNLRKNGWLDRIEEGSFLQRKAQELDVALPESVAQ